MRRRREREEARLQRLFERVAFASLAAPALALGCSQANDADGGRDAAVQDAASDPCDPTLEPDVALVKDQDGGVECIATEHYPCGLPAGVSSVDASCAFDLAACQSLCPVTGAWECRASDAACNDGVISSGEVAVLCSICPGDLGRRPRGLGAITPQRSRGVLGDFLARATTLEAASVDAFDALARELVRHGAPRALVRQARAAARDEVRHAHAMGALAEKHGAIPAPARVASSRRETLASLGRQNATEGCVRETYGALLAMWQARHARDGEVRAALARIFEDETRHAALAWRLRAWIEQQLSASTRRRIQRAITDAVATLEREVREPAPELCERLGMPDAATQRALIAGLSKSLWQSANV